MEKLGGGTPEPEAAWPSMSPERFSACIGCCEESPGSDDGGCSEVCVSIVYECGKKGAAR